MIPLILSEARSADCDKAIGSDPVFAYWWGSPVEIASSIARGYREGSLSSADVGKARRATELLLSRGIEVTPSERVRLSALQLIRQHPLRAADAFQLAALLSVGSGGALPEFVCLDDRLRSAAMAEGALVLP